MNESRKKSGIYNSYPFKAEHVGRGVLNLYRTGFNDYLDLFAIIDWQAIHEITVQHNIPLEPCTIGKLQWLRTPFIGGVSDGQFGLAVMDTASHNLPAKRSWHFYDDAVIALATNLISLIFKTKAPMFNGYM
jgi:chondroitin AC lyase